MVLPVMWQTFHLVPLKTNSVYLHVHMFFEGSLSHLVPLSVQVQKKIIEI